MNHKWLWLFLVLGGALALQTCTLPQPCTIANLSAPGLVSPAMWEVVSSLSPTLHWEYPGPYLPAPLPAPFPYPYPYPAPYPASYPSASCYPEFYRVRLSTGPEFLDELGGDTNSTSWTPSPLEPGKEYRWGIFAFVGETGKFSGSRVFFTGPICECDSDSLLAPTLIGPTGTIDDLYPTLMWDYPGDCSPQSYRVDLSTDPSFEDTSLSGGTGNPSSRWGPANYLQDCMDYYYRVAVVCETPDGETIMGPYSATESFSTEESACLEPILFQPPMFTPTIDGNCRLGPNTLYQRVLVAEPGLPLEVIGRNENGDWFLVRAREGVECWMADVTGEFVGDKKLVEVNTNYPALPEKKPNEKLKCNYDSAESCKAAGCKWVSNYPQPGYCTEP
jgi:hypothetical protein